MTMMALVAIMVLPVVRCADGTLGAWPFVVWGRNTHRAARMQIGFRIAVGYVGYPPASYTRYPAWGMLQFGWRTASSARDLRAFIAAKA